VRPKKSIQKKRRPIAAWILCSSLSTGVTRRGFHAPLATRGILSSPLGLFQPKAAVLGAANGSQNTFIRCMDFLLPRMARPSIDALSRNRPKGRGTTPRGDKGTRRCLLSSPAQGGDAQDQRAIRVSFLLGPFLWTSKEKDLGRGSENPHSKQPSRQRLFTIESVATANSAAGNAGPSNGSAFPANSADYCPLTRIPPASSMRSPVVYSRLTISVRYSRRWRVIRKLSRTNCRALWPISSILCRSWSR